MRSTGFWTRILFVLIVVGLTVSGPGCASTKNVMNKATFGLVGSEDDAAAEEKRAAKEQEKAEKQAAKEQKQAEKEAKKQEESDRGFMSKATFGMVGGDSEEKAAKKEAKRQSEEQKKAEKRAAKEQKKAEKQAREDEKRMAKSQAEPSPSAEEPKRGFMNKATFGLVGGDSEEKAAKKEAKRQAEAEKEAEKQAAEEQKQAEKQARKDEEQMAKAEPAETEEESKRGFMSKATFGLVGGDSEEKAAKKEAKQAAKEQEKAEKQARKEEKQMAKAQEDAAEESETADAPKRSLMSKLTFGLVGNGDGEPAGSETVEDEMPVSTPEPPVAMAGGDGAGDVQPASAMSGEFQKLARLDFETEVSYDSMSASGKQQAVASRSTYSKHGFGITDLGDVRIAVRDMTFSGGSRGGRIIISSEDRAPASGTAGIGNESFTFDYAKGVTACTFGTIQFTIATGVIVIDGQSVPMGQGHKLVVIDSNGSVEGVYAIE